MFQLTAEEVKNLRSKIATKNLTIKSRSLPYAFTEHGVLKSETAVKAGIHIINVFVKMREVMLTHKEIVHKLEQVEKQNATQDTNIKQLHQYIKMLMLEKKNPRAQIGFKVQ